VKYNDPTIEQSVLEMLKTKLGSDLVSSSFIPVGEESYAYCVTVGDGKKYFVKYCDQPKILENIDRAYSLLLQLQHLEFVVPPVEINGQTSFAVDKGKITIFPYIEGSVVPMTNKKFDQKLIDTLIQMLVIIHSATPPALTNLPKEDFENDYIQRIELLTAEKHRFAQKADLLLDNNLASIRKIIDKQNLIGSQYQQQNPDMVLTHGDVTSLNMIVTPEGNVKIVDWDGAMLAPRERDLNFLYDNPNFSLDKYASLSDYDGFDLELKQYYGRQWALDSTIGNFESLLNGSTSKTDENEYLEEIEKYLGYYV